MGLTINIMSSKISTTINNM